MQEQFAILGATVERDEEDGTDSVEVWAANWKSFVTFRDCDLHWRYLSGMAGTRRLGLDLAQVDVILRRRRLRGGVFNDLLVMERAAVEAFDEASE